MHANLPLCIGIDLGTTNSLCGVFQDGRPQLIPNADRKFLTPSVVGLLPSGEVIVGQAAVDLRVTNPQRTAACFKRFMGTDRQLSIAGRSFSAPELSSLVLKSLVRDAQAYLQQPVEQAVITVPAYFNDHQRKATQVAGEMAGLTVRRIINEPTAAALVYGFNDPQLEQKICVVDLGGGTFDVTVMDVFEGTLEIQATAGECLLGGEDFTERLVAAVLKQKNLQLEQAELKLPKMVSRLRYECNLAKCRLAQEEEASIRIPTAEGIFADSPPIVRVQRRTFDKLCDNLMERIRKPLGKAIRDASITPQEIDEVILVGGATRMTVMQEAVNSFFGRPGRMEFNPDEVVALGAAIQAALIQQDKAVADLVMTDVCPFTLGVEVCKEIGGRLMPGYFVPLIHRNSTIPISKEEEFHTIYDNQQFVEVRVFQGDARRVDDNIELGTLKVDKLPPGKAGASFYVRFTYDLNGVLEVEAYAPGGRKHRTILTNHVKGLSPEQIQQAAERLEKLKFYPREDVRHQSLARFCERLLGELPITLRQQLDWRLDQYESALAQGQRDVAEQARHDLIAALAAMGVDYEENLQ